MKRVIAAAAVAVLTIAAPSFAAGQLPRVDQPGARTLIAPPVSATSAVPRDPNERICETHTEVGSRLNRRRTCMTRAQWDAMRSNVRDSAREDAQRGLQGGPPRG